MSDIPQIAVVGSGYWGKNLVRNFHALGALAAVCEADPAARDRIVESYPVATATDDFAAILAAPEIDAVAISTPAQTHGDLVRRALMADKDVYVEKPLCLAESEAADLVRLAGQRRRILMVGHLLWYHH